MSFKCCDCGSVFDEPKIITETHGFSSAPYEHFGCCPSCGGGFEEAVICKICGEKFLKDELNGRCVCDECLDEYNRDFDVCYKVADTEKREIKINSLLVSLLGASKIEAVLYHILKEKRYVDCSAYINEDKDWFAKRLVEEVGK